MMVSNKGDISTASSPRFLTAVPALADANIKGQSSCESSASRSRKSSSTSSTTSSLLASGLSILLTHTITGSLSSSAFLKTNLVWGIGPSNASTKRITPLTILSTRSTSPPKSACPGVSIILILTPL